jgi:hypothetical protein
MFLLDDLEEKVRRNVESESLKGISFVDERISA